MKKVFPQLVRCTADRPALLGDGSAGEPLPAGGCKVGVAPNHADAIPARKSEDFGHHRSKGARMVCPAIRKSVLHMHIAVGGHLYFGTVAGIEATTAAKALRYPLKIRLLVVVAHLSVVMHGQAQSDSALEPSRHAARLWISFFPSDGFRSLLQHFDGGE